MTRYIILGTLLIASAAAAVPQFEHAPTVEQCRADQAAWTAEMQGPGGESKQPFSVLSGRMKEMSECFAVDLERKESPTNGYLFLNDIIVKVMAAREIRFIARHGLTQEFQSEDEAGQR